MSDYYVVAVCHTHRDHEYITLWRPDDCGYTPVLPRAGRYSRGSIEAHLPYYHQGEHVAVKASVLDSLAVEVPPKYFDYAGPAIQNSKENWRTIMAALEWATRWPIKPDWRGKRGRRR
jgi:hypothetical protein